MQKKKMLSIGDFDLFELAFGLGGSREEISGGLGEWVVKRRNRIVKTVNIFWLIIFLILF